MQSATLILATLASIAAATPYYGSPAPSTGADHYGPPVTAGAQATLQFEFEDNGFTANDVVALPGTFFFEDDTSLISVGIATIDGLDENDQQNVECQAFDGEKRVGEPFTILEDVKLDNGNLVPVTSIECE